MVGFIIFVVLAVVAAVLGVVFLPFHDGASVTADLAVAAPMPAAPLTARAQYLPPRPADAPESVRAQVLRGQSMMLQRSQPGRSYRQLACSSCHFSGGLSDGGRNNGFSLVGAATRFPLASPLLGLVPRIAACYRNNLNLSPPGPNDDAMLALEAYLRWISSGLPFLFPVPWMHTQPLVGASANAAAGAATWRDVCAPCHGDHGEGTRIATATWGDDSFTTGSPLLAAGVLERFIKDNMPRGNPNLDDKAAIDVAAFLRAQPRPARGGH